MSKITVVARLTVQDGAIEVVKRELLKMITPTRAEEGCLEYRLHQDIDTPNLFIFYENWADAASLERHLDSEHFRSYAAAVGDLLIDKVVSRMDEIG